MNTDDRKRERFRRLATRRTITILDRIRVLGNCSNRNDYLYTQEEVEKIFDAIERELKKVKNKFYSSKKDIYKFTL